MDLLIAFILGAVVGFFSMGIACLFANRTWKQSIDDLEEYESKLFHERYRLQVFYEGLRERKEQEDENNIQSDITKKAMEETENKLKELHISLKVIDKVFTILRLRDELRGEE